MSEPIESAPTKVAKTPPLEWEERPRQLTPSDPEYHYRNEYKEVFDRVGMERWPGARTLLDDLCTSIGVAKEPDRLSKPVRWEHRARAFASRAEVLEAWKRQDYGISRDEFRDAVTNYLDQEWMHTPFWDWYCADVLTFAEIIATLEVQDPSTRVRGGPIGLFIIMAGWFALGWLLLDWMLFVGVAWFCLTTPYLLLFFGMIAFVRIRFNWLRSRMLGAYRYLDVVNWKTGNVPMILGVFTRELDDTRRLGAVWDLELWRLVEMKSQSLHSAR